MISNPSTELFRYLRVRGLAAGSAAAATVIAPPAGLGYGVLTAASASPGSIVGLPVARKAIATLPIKPPGVDAFIVLGRILADGGEREASMLALAQAAAPAASEQIVWLWDSLALTLLSPARHDDSEDLANALRSVWLCDRLRELKSQPEARSREHILKAARSAVVHLVPITEPAEAPTEAPAPSPNPPPAVENPKTTIAAMEYLITELRNAPLKLVERPLPESAALPLDRSDTFGWFGFRQRMAALPTTYTALQSDLSGLSVGSLALVRNLGGLEITPAMLIDRAESRITSAARSLAAMPDRGYRLVVSGGVRTTIRLPMHDAADEIVGQAPTHGGAIGHIHSLAPVKCSVRVRALAEFLRVEQTLDCYQANELAHLENMLQGEMKERLTRSLTRSEQTLIEEAEREEETQREQSTTERFQIENNAQKALTSVAETHGGVSASMSATGTNVTILVEGNLGFSSQSTKEEVEKTATEFSKSVTSRVLETVKTRVSEKRISQLLNEFEDTSRHVLDNRGNSDHVVAAFRWVDKVYSAQVMNYGARVAIEVLIADPAAFLRPTQTGSIELPTPLDDASHPLGPLNSARDMTRSNYAYFASRYGADIKPPLPQTAIVSTAEVRPPDIYGGAVHVAGQIDIPEGYAAVRYTVRGDLVNWWYVTSPATMRVFVAGAEAAFQSYTVSSAPLNYCTGKLPYALASWTRMYSMTLTVECELMREAFEGWQLESYLKIKAAYDRAVQAAESAAAQEQARQGIVIQGRNPLMNDQIIRNELKKAVISALCVGAPFWLDGSGTVVCEVNGTTLPKLDEQTCQKLKLASLLESAIDWKLMTYQLLPYYWANACQWQELMGYGDADPLYADFLRSGAARVVVPVANGEAAALELLYFLSTGNRWTGSGPPPLVSDMEALAAFVESKEVEDNAPIPVGDSWRLTVPTSLTVLECGSACVDGDKVAAPLIPAGSKTKLVAGATAEHE